MLCCTFPKKKISIFVRVNVLLVREYVLDVIAFITFLNKIKVIYFEHFIKFKLTFSKVYRYSSYRRLVCTTKNPARLYKEKCSNYPLMKN